MDNTEVWSDCSESSLLSSGSTSNLSGLSGYKEEFQELSHLLNPKTYPELSLTKQKDIRSWYDTHIENVTKQLQNALKQNEKYKNELYNLEKKAQLSRNANFEQLLIQNKQLETNLAAANQQIRRLTGQGKTKTTAATLDQKLIKLEKANHELNLQNFKLNQDLNQANYQLKEYENDCKNVKNEINELRLDLAAKSNCVNDLKAKISEQHVERQQLLQDKTKLSHLIDATARELEFAKKSENWYKNELHQLQQEKVNLFQEIIEIKNSQASQNKECESLKLEINKLKCEGDEIRLLAIKEKEFLLKKLEHLCQTATTPSENHSDYEKIINNYELTINDLSNDVTKLKFDFDQQQSGFEKLKKENVDLMGKYLTLQGTLKEKNYVLEKSENLVKDLKAKVATLMDRESINNVEILQLKTENSNLQIALNVSNQEKQNIEQSVQMIKNQFKIFKQNYENLKNEWQKKKEEVLQLQFENQELCMNNKWKSCEIEKISIEMNNLNLQNDHYVKTNKNLNLLEKEKDSIIENLNDEISKLKNSQSFTLNQLNVTEALNYVHKMCCAGTISDAEDKNIILKLLCKIYKHLCCDEKKIKMGQKMKNIQASIGRLSEKCRELKEKTEENSNLLQLLNTKQTGEEIQHLQALLQVKMREMKEKQKKYEINYRTLLRKVKEHMKGRNLAEKHYLYLQQLHHDISDECNTLKLQISEKNREITELQNRLENYLCHNQHFKFNSETDCEKCQKFEEAQTQLDLKNQLIDKLNKENQDYIKIQHANDEKIENLFEINKQLSAKLNNLENTLSIEKGINKKYEVDYLTKCGEISEIKSRLEDLTDKHSFILTEVEQLNLCLKQKSDELCKLQEMNAQNEICHIEKNSRMQELITSLKLQLQSYKNEINSITNDKYFLQRLCNDLRMSLKIYIHQNKSFKELLSNSNGGKDEFHILSKFPSPVVKFDDIYIEKLLQENRAPLQDKPLSDLQGCLDTLKQEIFVLQKQIVEKNRFV